MRAGVLFFLGLASALDYTPLHEAAWSGDLSKVISLVDGELVKGNLAAALAATDDPDGCTPLHKAAQMGHLEVVKELLSRGAPVDALDNSGLTPLHSAASKDFLDIVKALVAKGAALGLMEKSAGWTPLHMAAVKGNKEVMRFLANRGAPLLASPDGVKFVETPEQIARRVGWPDEADILRDSWFSTASAEASKDEV
eukprot:CAMPEP_0183351704 /NCGR_PEP_ID=MMETSP0164_2-20130417/26199_1 /TAXON_ID=221442 /ORGANISM="Coccolithus pelagicus ssp braarudi, Strain PLY182g" /LENGTH=196 /DNA_ID=CAMNT_0025523953 /DNA_START=26 /DNA_END=616 /DNA_ORIENTATION=+